MSEITKERREEAACALERFQEKGDWVFDSKTDDAIDVAITVLREPVLDWKPPREVMAWHIKDGLGRYDYQVVKENQGMFIYWIPTPD